MCGSDGTSVLLVLIHTILSIIAFTTEEILQIHPQAVAVPSTAASENTGRSSQVHSEIGTASYDYAIACMYGIAMYPGSWGRGKESLVSVVCAWD